MLIRSACGGKYFKREGNKGGGDAELWCTALVASVRFGGVTWGVRCKRTLQLYISAEGARVAFVGGFIINNCKTNGLVIKKRRYSLSVVQV